MATLPSGYGPRVQLSVFECQIRTKMELKELRAAIRATIDHEEDQVRLYQVSDQTSSHSWIIGAREIEERRDFWLIR